MMYVKFDQKRIIDNRSKISYCRNKPDTEKIIYKANYPKQIVEYKAEVEEPCNVEMQHNKEENEIIKEKSNGISRALTCVMTTILIFASIYLSEIRAPEYIENQMLYLIQIAEKIKNPDIRKEEVTKIFGEKAFVSAEEEEVTENTPHITEVYFDENNDKNTSFADMIANESKKDVQGIAPAENITNKVESVIGRNMSAGSDKIYFTNKTSITLDGNELLNAEYPIEKYAYSSVNEPLVLIIHTHGTEGYIDSDNNNTSRSTDTSRNIVRVGEELTKVLEQYGIQVIHSKTMHDEISYVKAYDNSKAEAKLYLEKYPSIKYVIDVHRDALGEDGEIPVKTYTEINGEKAAQLMFVMGTNANGGNHPDFLKNLTVAAHIQQNANEIYPGLMRPINVRPIIFNQNLTDGCMLLEVGSDANTLEESLNAVRMFARCFSQTVKQ